MDRKSVRENNLWGAEARPLWDMARVVALLLMLAMWAGTSGCPPSPPPPNDNGNENLNENENFNENGNENVNHNDNASCEGDVQGLFGQAGEDQNQLVEVEDGDGDGRPMPRSSGSSEATILLYESESRTVSVVLSEPGIFELWLIYSNDGPGTEDVVEATVNGHTFSFRLEDTRGDLLPGDGWNQFCVAGPSERAVLLDQGDSDITFTLTSADEYGCELDAVVLLSPDTPTVEVITLDELRTAIGITPSNGRLIVASGSYTVSETIDVARDDITIEGEGEDGDTVFTLADDVNCPVFVLGEPAPLAPQTTRRNITLRNLRVNGNRTEQTSELCSVPGREHLRANGITVRQAEDCTVENVTVESSASGGIVLEQSCSNIELRGIESFDHRFDGIAWDGDVQDSLISDCILRNNLAAGISFDLGPANNEIADCEIRDNGTVGVFIRDSDHNCFTNCTLESNGEDGVFIADGDAPDADAVENAFVDNQYLNNGRNGMWQAGQRSVSNCEAGGTFDGNGNAAKMESFPADAPLVDCDTSNACTE